jgi:hypothetical protein
MTLNSEAIFKHFRARFDPSIKRGIEVSLPAWVDIKTWQKGKAVKDVMSSFQSVLAIRFACSRLFEKTHGFFDVDSDGGVPGKLTALTVMLRIIPPCFSNAENDLSQDVIHNLEVISSADPFKALSAEIAAQYRDNKSANIAINELLCQGFDRDGAIFTPKDVAIFMGRLAGIESDCVDIYCNYGTGLYYGNAIHHAANIRLVGNEVSDKDNSWPRQFPERLDLAYKQAEYSFSRSAVLERMATELEWATFGQDEKKSKSLLINAALNDLPFYESFNSEKSAESLDHLLKAGYKKVVVLVPNAYLTGGRGLGNSQNVFKHCVSMGLAGVIQLPAGAIGASHEAYSILEFEPGVRSTKIDFRNIDFGVESDSARLYQKADRGFGLPMRRNELNLGSITSEGGMPQASRTIRSVDDVLSLGISHLVRSKRSAQLVSFEATRFIEKKGFKDLYPHFQFVPLSELVNIYRIQHMQSALPEDGIEYLEIGGNDIGPFGNIESGTKKYIDEISEARLEKARLRPGDLFLCIRGSVGKVCLMGPETDIPTVPNQSFVKLSFKKAPKENELSPELLFWWLNSAQCREMLASKALSQGVPRLSISDVADIDIPAGPWAILELEYRKYNEWTQVTRTALDYSTRAHAVSATAFKV